MILALPRSARLAHSTTEYRRNATIVFDGVLYACGITIAPTRRYERLNPATRTSGSDPTTYAKQLGLIHFALGPQVLTTFYNTLSLILCPRSPPLITQADEVWLAWQQLRPEPSSHALRAACLIPATSKRSFDEVIAEFLHAERRTRPGYKYSRADY